MTSDIEIFSKDSIKLDILQDVISGKVKLLFQLNDGSTDDYMTNIHNDRNRVQVYGKFNISEDSNGEVLTIRPVMVDNKLRISFNISSALTGKKVSVVRSATKTVAQEYDLTNDTVFLDLIPQGKQNYVLCVVRDGGISASPNIADQQPAKPHVKTPSTTKPVIENGIIKEEIIPGSQTENDDRFQSFDLDASSEVGVHDDRFASFGVDNDAVISSTSKAGQNISAETEIENVNTTHSEPAPSPTQVQADDGELRRIEQEISVVEKNQSQLSRKRQSAIDHLEKIEAEYKKDYESLEKDLEEIKSRMEADAMVIEHYKDQDVTPIEVIFQEIKLKLEEAENQIRFFIEAKQKKTMEIENEIKSNKKQ